MGIRAWIDRRRTPKAGRSLLKQMQKQTAAETRRIASQGRREKIPFVKKIIKSEVKRRRQIAKGKGDGRIIETE